MSTFGVAFEALCAVTEPKKKKREMTEIFPEKTRPILEKMPKPNSPGTVVDFGELYESIHLLHLNESPFEPSPKAIEAMAKASHLANRYSDPNASELTTEISRRTGVPSDCIVVGSGLEDIIRILAELFVDEGDEVLVPAPSFPLFAVSTRIERGVPVRIGITDQGSNDISLLLDRVTNRTRMAYCCTPNPPNGGVTPYEDVARLAKELPENVLLVLDEAYHEFAIHAGHPDPLPALRENRKNWVSLRTFSKAYGLAGLRVGYALCANSEIAEAIRKFRLAYSPTIVSQAAALAALKDDNHLASVLNKVVAERDRLAEQLRTLGLEPYPTSANFVSVKLEMPGLVVAEKLREKGVLVRDWRDPDYPNEIRISVGTGEDTDACISALREILLESEEPQ